MLRFDLLQEGTRVRLARVAAGMTLHDVGVRAGVSPPRLSEYERGRGTLPPDAIARVWAVLDDAAREAGLGRADAVA